MKKIALTLAMISGITAANAALVLVPNGDFAIVAGASWVSATSGVSVSYPSANGASGAADGFGKMDQTAGGWGGVLVAEGSGPGIPLSSLGMTAGQTYTFSLDMKNLGSGSPIAGMKIENWNGAIINNSGDITFPTSDAWTTRTFTFAVSPTATAIKFVPLMVNQPLGSSVGFDNVGVVLVPEPASAMWLGLGAVAMVAARRRR